MHKIHPSSSSYLYVGASNKSKRPHLLRLELTLAQPLAICRGQFAAVLKVMRIIVVVVVVIVIVVVIAITIAFAALAVAVAKTRGRGARGGRCDTAERTATRAQSKRMNAWIFNI